MDDAIWYLSGPGWVKSAACWLAFLAAIMLILPEDPDPAPHARLAQVRPAQSSASAPHVATSALAAPARATHASIFDGTWSPKIVTAPAR